MENLEELKKKWETLRDRVHFSLKKVGRSEASLQILPVTKTRKESELEHWLRIPDFPRIFGENYVQELERKFGAFKEAQPPVHWHFIGALQSRKIQELCSQVKCLQTVSRVKELEALLKCQNKGLKIPEFYVQVNVSSEKQKNGLAPEDLPKFLEEIAKVGFETKLQGLMCLPEPLETVSEKILRYQFSHLRQLRDRYFPQGKLSMGMSSDFEWAIEEGSDLIRVGTILFGERETKG